MPSTVRHAVSVGELSTQNDSFTGIWVVRSISEMRSTPPPLKKKAENGLDHDIGKEDARLDKWIRKDMMRHED